MKIAFDISPLENGHKYRGTGSYVNHLMEALLSNGKKHKFHFYSGDTREIMDADIIHYPYFSPFQVTLPRKKYIKTVVTIHDLTPLVFPEHFPAGVRGNFNWFIQKRRLKNIDAVITDSEASRKDITRYAGVPEDKVFVVYLAAGDEFKSAQNPKTGIHIIKQKYHLPEKFVLYVGDVTWNKNLPRLILAVQEMNITLVIAGKAIAQDNFDITNAWNRDLLKVKEMIKNDKRFIVLDFIPREDLVILYQSATFMAMPSLYEGFGLPVLEAMQSGCPVIASKEGSLGEVAGDAALYVDPHDIKNMTEGLGELYSNVNLQKSLKAKGLKQAAKFSWKETALQTIAVYEKVLAG